MTYKKRVRVRLDKGLFLVNGVVYFERLHHGKLIRRKAVVQGSAALNERKRPTADLIREKKAFDDAVVCDDFHAIKMHRVRSAVTVAEMVDAYRKACEEQRSVYRSPTVRSECNNISAFIRIATAAGLKMSDGVAKLDAAAVKGYVSSTIASGVGNDVSAWSTIAQARSLFSSWAMDMYARDGVTVPACVKTWPKSKAAYFMASYKRPGQQLVGSVMRLYARLERMSPEHWLAMTLMLQFAMRPNDAAALQWCDFEVKNDRVILRYVPNKTRGRTAGGIRPVEWPFSLDLYARMEKLRGTREHVVSGNTYLMRYQLYIRDVNRLMTACGFGEAFSKKCYELRKMCVDRVYKTYGVEKAAQISGDNISTIMKYYVDSNRTDFVADVVG